MSVFLQPSVNCNDESNLIKIEFCVFTLAQFSNFLFSHFSVVKLHEENKKSEQECFLGSDHVNPN